MKEIIKNLFTPFGHVSRSTRTVTVICQVVIVILVLQVFHSPIVPPPVDVFNALMQLLQSSSLYENLFASFQITIFAMFISIMATMVIVYLSTIPFFTPIASMISKFRYLTITGLAYLFRIFSDTTSQLKLSLLIFGIVPFFITSFLSVVNSIPSQQIDKSFINRRGPWETLYEVVFVGRLDQLLDVMRQNFAISWMMITTVEAYDMSGGGIGTLLISSNKFHDMAPVFAMLVVVLCIGLFFDWALSKLRTTTFKYV